jgi:hypothetical protein
MSIEFTSRAGASSSSRYIEVYYGEEYVSRHAQETEAVESASKHAEDNQLVEANYEFRYPAKMVLIRQTQVIQQSGGGGVPVPDVIINSVNGGADVYNNQSVVNIVGSGFGSSQGTVKYYEIDLAVLSWSDTAIEVAWVDAPFDAVWKPRTLPMTSSVEVINFNGKSGARTVTTVANPVAYYGVITSTTATGSIYADDIGIEVSVDKAYVRVIDGTMDMFNVATGVPSGLSDPATLQYVIWDESEQLWSDEAQEVFTSNPGELLVYPIIPGGIFDTADARSVITNQSATWSVLTSDPLDGTFLFYNGGGWFYTRGTQTGTASFTYTVYNYDGQGNSTSATHSVIVQ